MLADFIDGLREDDGDPALPGTTRGDLARLVRGYAVALAAEGLTAGDTVALAVRPGARSLATLMAAYHLGLRIAVLDPTAGPEVVRARLALAEPRLVLADAAAQAVAGWAAPLARRAHLALPDLSSIAPVKTIGRRLPGSPPALRPLKGQRPRPYAGEGDAVVVFTSGTTSHPRAGRAHPGLDLGRHGRGARPGAPGARPAGARRHLLRAAALAGQRCPRSLCRPAGGCGGN